jgi:hypothetical protein
MSAAVIEIKPHRWGWKIFEAPGVEPVFPEMARIRKQRPGIKNSLRMARKATPNIGRVIPKKVWSMDKMGR